MKGHLLSQMRNEWRSNLWLLIELTIVGIIMWFIYLSLITIRNASNGERGYDLDDVVVGTTRFVTSDSPEYEPYDSLHSYQTDFSLLLAQLRQNPMVEAVGYGQNGMAYNYNYHGSGVFRHRGDSMVQFFGNVRNISPEAALVFRLTGPRGETSEQLRDILAKGEIVLGMCEFADSVYRNHEAMRNQDVFFGNDTTHYVHVGAIAYGIRRNDYETGNGVIYNPINNYESYRDVYIRVKPGKSRDFLKSLGDKTFQVGNVYIAPFRTVDDMRAYAHHDINVLIRNFAVCALFLLLMIFFGFLGTFWFRTQQRVPEIAIRKVNGATDRNVFARFLGEGLILVGLASILVLAATLVLHHYRVVEIGFVDFDNFSFYILALLASMLTLAILTIAGIWFPARKAMRINAAIALKDQ